MSHDRLVGEQRKRSKVIVTKLSEGTMSAETYDSTIQPWYMADKALSFEIGHKPISDCPPELNHSITLMYNVIGDPDREIYIGDWTIVSWNKAKKRYDVYKEDKQTKIFDIAHIYTGMGHIRVLACDLTTHNLFYHDAGGANGYESKHNYDKLMLLDPSTQNQMFFSEWFQGL